jgi:hypothetical protein
MKTMNAAFENSPSSRPGSAASMRSVGGGPKSATTASSAADDAKRAEKKKQQQQQRDLRIFGVIEGESKELGEMLDFGDDGGMEEAFKFELELCTAQRRSQLVCNMLRCSWSFSPSLVFVLPNHLLPCLLVFPAKATFLSRGRATFGKTTLRQ